MQDRDDQWDITPLDDTEDGGVLWPVLRNAGILVGASLVAVWMLLGLAGGPANESPGAQLGRQAAAPGQAAMREPIPAYGGGNELIIPAGENGHFMVDTMTNGRPIRYLVDTGASGVLLSQADARSAGISLGALTFGDRVQTANGDISVARTTVREIRIAGLIVKDVEAWVTSTPLPISLLGMTFLSRLASYEARGDKLILRW